MVLIADDDPVNGMLTAALVERLGFLPVRAVDGQQALDAWGRHVFALIMMDLHMPELNGFQATQLIRQHEALARTMEGLRIHAIDTFHWALTETPRIPIIGMTATASPDIARFCLDVGMDGLVQKPLSLDRLKTLLDRWAMRAAASESEPNTP